MYFGFSQKSLLRTIIAFCLFCCCCWFTCLFLKRLVQENHRVAHMAWLTSPRGPWLIQSARHITGMQWIWINELRIKRTPNNDYHDNTILQAVFVLILKFGVLHAIIWARYASNSGRKILVYTPIHAQHLASDSLMLSMAHPPCSVAPTNESLKLVLNSKICWEISKPKGGEKSRAH